MPRAYRFPGSLWSGMLSRSKHALRHLARSAATRSSSRRLLNLLYHTLTYRQKNLFYRGFAKVFRDTSRTLSPGEWRVRFAGRNVRLPLTRQRSWLDWDLALSLVGHDVEIAQTYAFLIKSHNRPDLFLDVGANYGLHSLLFLTHGIGAISFEPNMSCHDYFRESCSLNGVQPSIEKVAIGDSDGHVELWYPEHDTWLGLIANDVKQRPTSEERLLKQTVTMKKIDDYTDALAGRQLLMKIDTEGGEYQVLRGAQRTLQTQQPLVLFECWKDADRHDIFGFLASQNYRLAQLPWTAQRQLRLLDSPGFLNSRDTNFLAVPEALLTVQE